MKKNYETLHNSIHQAIKEKKYDDAYQVLLTLKSNLDIEASDDQEAYIIVFTLINRMLRFLYEQDVTRYHMYDLKKLLDTYVCDDALFLINGYVELLETMNLTKDFQGHYDIYVRLLSLYRFVNDRDNIKKTYQKLIKLIDALKSNVIAYAHQQDNIELEVQSMTSISSLTYDIVEETRYYKRIKFEVEKKIIEQIGLPGRMGYCYPYWSLKQEILKTQYHISWMSPGVLNDALFD